MYVEKKSFYATEQARPDVVERRADFIASLEEIDPKDIIVLDEAGADLSLSTDYSRAIGGSRAIASKPFDSGAKFSIIGAMSQIGIEAMMYVESATDSLIFSTFIEKHLVPKLRKGQYVVMDNVRFHHCNKVRELVESVEATVVFLPPYSPDLSPIEKLWSKTKTILRRLMPRSKAEFHSSLGEALSEITPEDCHEWFEACGYA